ncbi:MULTISPECIES: zinc-binding dehydrogenase [Nocardiopsis]|uniref:Zinc-binding dehydrogenase n=1 Tax=Nocardiopsis sinuspersici TaxID=501010 RepID=A0A1V3C9T6_9ACTN|nr:MULTISPECIES: zinc-binding dehydrogenase [Nocardiopsis]OOC57412.1 zinc-binding dehydrogenase [Nocardiopsis sinuspersici]
MATMRAARLNVRTRTLELKDVPRPVPGRGQVLVRVKAAGVCLSDVHLIDGTLKPLYLEGDEVTLGHEVSGVVEEIGPDVMDPEVGDRVILQAGQTDRSGKVLTRGVDYDGGWAEYALADEETLVPIPDDLPFDQAAIIPDAVSTPWAAVTSTADVGAAEAVAVWGVGGLGAHAVKLLRLVGAAPIIAADPDPQARKRALAFGADVALDPAGSDFLSTVGEMTGGQGLNVAFDFAGVPTVREQALRVLGEHGRLVLVGLTDKPLEVRDGTRFSYLQQQILGHYGSEPEHVVQLVELVNAGRVDFASSISGTLSLEEAPMAVEQLEKRTGSPIRLVLEP